MTEEKEETRRVIITDEKRSVYFNNGTIPGLRIGKGEHDVPLSVLKRTIAGAPGWFEGADAFIKVLGPSESTAPSKKKEDKKGDKESK